MMERVRPAAADTLTSDKKSLGVDALMKEGPGAVESYHKVHPAARDSRSGADHYDRERMTEQGG